MEWDTESHKAAFSGAQLIFGLLSQYAFSAFVISMPLHSRT